MSTKIEKNAASEILKGIKIPPQPQIMVDIQLEMAMPDFSLGDIADLIPRDVGISGGILKTVNSSYFGLKKLSEYLCGTYRVLGKQDVDHEFERLREPLLTYLGLSDIDLNNLQDDLFDKGITTS